MSPGDEGSPERYLCLGRLQRPTKLFMLQSKFLGGHLGPAEGIAGENLLDGSQGTSL